MSSSNNIPAGRMRFESTQGLFNNISFVVQQSLRKMQTATLVKIVSCTNNGDLSPVGFVDVIPLINQIDSQGNPTEHITIYNIPYFRLQGGANAVIIDPEPGDIGICIFASRDISKVKSTKNQANPGSLRQYSFADGLYVGGVLNAVPSQYVQFNSDRIKIYSPALITLEAPDIKLEAETVEILASTSATVTTPTFTVNGATVLNGTLTQGKGSAGGACDMLGPLNVDNDVVAQGISVHDHTHGGVEPGSGTTGGPQ